MQRQNGFSFVELIVVIALISIVLTLALINFGPSVLSVSVDAVAANIIASIETVRRDALRADTKAKSYNISKDAYSYSTNNFNIKSYPGMELKTSLSVSAGCGSCSNGLQSICISNENYCYSSGTDFDFQSGTGRLPSNRVIYIITRSRKLAILITTDGHADVAELNNGKWLARSDIKGWNR